MPSKSVQKRLEHQAPRGGRAALVAGFQRAVVERFAGELAPGKPATHVVRWTRLDTPAGMGPVDCFARVPAAALDRVLDSLFAAAQKSAAVTAIESALLSDTTGRVRADVEDKLRQLGGGR